MTDKSVVPEGMVAWAGGDGPPADWDGGPALWQTPYGRDYSETTAENRQWAVYSDDAYNIIAYTPRSNPLNLETSDLDPITPEEDAAATGVIAALGFTREAHDTVVRGMRAGLAKAGAVIVPGWQPIETAPRDGTPVLITNLVRGGTWIAKYSARYASGMNRENPWFSLMLNTRWHEHQYASMTPTHWMPLPSAHSIQSGGEGGEG